MNEQMSQPETNNWKLGVFYVDPQNPALWVRKRFSPGMTINLGHPRGRLIMAGIGSLLGLVILTPVVITLIIIVR
jgi:uncharacterized membrane protein